MTDLKGSDMDAREKRPAHWLAADDAGIGLAEILVAMFLLATLAVAFLPLLISSLQLTIRTSQTNTATQLLNEQLDLLASTESSCTAITAFASTAVPDVVDQRNVAYKVDRAAASCSALTYPAVITVELTIRIDDGSGREQSAESAFLVRGA